MTLRLSQSAVDTVESLLNQVGDPYRLTKIYNTMMADLTGQHDVGQAMSDAYAALHIAQLQQADIGKQPPRSCNRATRGLPPTGDRPGSAGVYPARLVSASGQFRGLQPEIYG
jgi:hypothetical protein